MSGWSERDVDDPISDDPISDDPEIQELVGGIATTREEMTVTVEEIGDRLDPQHIVANAKETVRDATVGKVEDMANTASEMVSTAGETVHEASTGLGDLIMRNPIPAAMIGIGIGWLAMSGRSSRSDVRRDGVGWGSSYSRGTGSSGRIHPGSGRYGSAGYATGEYQATSDAEPGLKDRASHLTDEAGRTVEQVRDQVGQMADEVPDRVQRTARDVGDQVGRMYQDNPLALGAVAVAVGTAVGLALPATQFERRTIGQPARQVLGEVEETASDALGQVEQSAREAEQQARQEDLRSQLD